MKSNSVSPVLGADGQRDSVQHLPFRSITDADRMRDRDGAKRDPTANARYKWSANSAKNMISLIDALREVEGPQKWARDDHGMLIILPYRHLQIREQVIVEADGYFADAYSVEYWLPKAFVPWRKCKGWGGLNNTAHLVVDALSRCEQEPMPRNDRNEIQPILDDISRGFNGHREDPS